MNIHPIRTESDYRAVLCQLSAYFNNESAPGTEDGDRFEVLPTLIEVYERRHFPIDAPDPMTRFAFAWTKAAPSQSRRESKVNWTGVRRRPGGCFSRSRVYSA